jgi:hypothetical protein
MRKVWIGLLIVSAVGFVASMLMLDNDDCRAYGEVPIPGSSRLHLPAGDVMVSFHAVMPRADEGRRFEEIPIPENLELVITAPSGAAQPSVTEKIGLTNATNTDEHRQVKVAHIPVAGDYTITTNAPESALRFTLDDKVTAFVSPRLSFGQGNPFGFLPWVFGGLCVVSVMASSRGGLSRLGVLRRPRSRTPISAVELRTSGQRVRGVLKWFKATGETMRNRGVTPSLPEFLDYPYYALVVELLLPDRAPVLGRVKQPIPFTEVPNLAIGRELNCAVDLADPSYRFVVLWS